MAGSPFLPLFSNHVPHKTYPRPTASAKQEPDTRT